MHEPLRYLHVVQRVRHGLVQLGVVEICRGPPRTRRTVGGAWIREIRRWSPEWSSGSDGPRQGRIADRCRRFRCRSGRVVVKCSRTFTDHRRLSQHARVRCRPHRLDMSPVSLNTAATVDDAVNYLIIYYLNRHRCQENYVCQALIM